MRRGNAATELAVDIYIVRIEVIGNAHFRSYTLSTFVDRGGRNMRVLVNNARCYVFAGTVNYAGTCIGKTFPYSSYLTIFNQYVRILQHTFFFVGPYRSVPDQDGFLPGRLSIVPAEGNKRVNNVTQRRTGTLTGTIFLFRCCLCIGGRPGKAVTQAVFTRTGPGIGVYYTAQAQVLSAPSFGSYIDTHLAAIVVKLGGNRVLANEAGSRVGFKIQRIIHWAARGIQYHIIRTLRVFPAIVFNRVLSALHPVLQNRSAFAEN